MTRHAFLATLLGLAALLAGCDGRSAGVTRRGDAWAKAVHGGIAPARPGEPAPWAGLPKVRRHG